MAIIKQGGVSRVRFTAFVDVKKALSIIKQVDDENRFPKVESR